jgi:pyruvate,orthophosphate dikinase
MTADEIRSRPVLQLRDQRPDPDRSHIEGRFRSFLPHYAELEIVKRNPFATIDATGVGQLVEMGVKKGRSVKKDLKLGICGEHGGDPDSITFFEKVGLDYVSASPFRVPVARLAAAQAALAARAAK